jgi:hypothetical protein
VDHLFERRVRRMTKEMLQSAFDVPLLRESNGQRSTFAAKSSG